MGQTAGVRQLKLTIGLGRLLALNVRCAGGSGGDAWVRAALARREPDESRGGVYVLPQRHWDDAKQMFDALHAAGIKYVISRNWEAGLPPPGRHPDIDFLVLDYAAAVATIGSEPAHAARYMEGTGGYRVQHNVKIAGRLAHVDVRFRGDNYMDPVWVDAIVRRRKLSPTNDFFVMAPADYLFTLSYHAVVQKSRIAADYITRLAQMGARLAARPEPIPIAYEGNRTAAVLRGTMSSASRAARVHLIRRHMDFYGYGFVVPRDKTVFCARQLCHSPSPPAVVAPLPAVPPLPASPPLGRRAS